MRSRKLGKITVGIAGATGTSGLGFAALKMASGHGVPAGMWAALAASFTTTSLVAALGLILQYRLGKLAAQAQAASGQRDAELRRLRLELQRSILAKTRGGAEGAQAYRTMATADALYLSVEQNGSLLDDQRHEQLYGTQSAAALP